MRTAEGLAAGDLFSPNVLPTPVPFGGSQVAEISAVGIWPLNVPATVVATTILLNPDAHPTWAAVTSEVLSAMTPIEKGLLGEDTVPDELAPLKASGALRWRLSALLSVQPKDLSKDVNVSALDAALLEADGVLSGLATPEDADPAIKEAFDGARAAIAKHVVTLADVAQKAAAHGAAVPSAEAQDAARARAAAQARAATAAKLVSVETIKPKKGVGRVLSVPTLFVVALLAGAGYHGWNLYMSVKSPPPPPVDTRVKLDLPEGVAATEAPNGDLRVFVTPGAKLPPEKLQKLRERADALGKVFREERPGMYAIESPRDAAQPPTPAAKQ